MNRTSTLLLSLLLLLAIVSLTIAINILLRGRVYQRLKPESRPRRWVLISLLFLFAVFAVWFPIWISWPQSMIARVLTATFAVVFGAVGMTLKWFNGIVDRYVRSKGWPLT